MAVCSWCGVALGNWHHPGCDVQRCPACGGQLLSCGCRFDEDRLGDRQDHGEPFGVDGNGCLTERVSLGDADVLVHYDDLPESDVTVVDGVPCTTALRTVIDLGPELDAADVESMLSNFLGRGLFTVEEAWERVSQPDMIGRRGADILRGILPPAP